MDSVVVSISLIDMLRPLISPLERRSLKYCPDESLAAESQSVEDHTRTVNQTANRLTEYHGENGGLDS